MLTAAAATGHCRFLKKYRKGMAVSLRQNFGQTAVFAFLSFYY